MLKFLETNAMLIVQALLVLGTLGYLALGFHKDGEEEDAPLKYEKGRLKKAALVFGVGLVLTSAIGFVPAGHRGVIFDRGQGVLEEERREGITLLIPFWQKVVNMSVRTQEYTFESFIQTKDLQEVTLPVTINYRITADSASDVYQNVGFDYQAVIINPAVLQATTSAAGQIIAEDIAQSRAILTASIQEKVAERLAEHGITVEFVAVRDAVFDSEFIGSVKAKVIADQKAQESERLVEVARNEAEQARQRAAGEADAQAKLGEGQRASIEEVAAALGFTTEEYLTYLRLTRWDGVLPSTLLGDSTDVIIDVP